MAGITVRGLQKKIYVNFYHNGKRHNEVTPYSCEKQGISGCKCRGCFAATAYGYEIERKILDGTFDLFDYFPNSRAIKKRSKKGYTFAEYADLWINLKSAEIRKSTLKKYEQAINYANPVIGELLLKEIKPMDIEVIKKMMVERGLAAKTFKETKGTISGVFKHAMINDVITKNPCAYVRGLKLPETDPDPFSVDEIHLILDWIEKRYPDKVLFYAIGFYSGMRTGEIVGLKWSAIDFRKRKIKVSRQHTCGEQVETTKTNRSRVIDIIPQLMPYIEWHKQYTFMKSEFLFVTQMNKPYTKADDFSRYYYKDCLKALGIRFRTLYHMRHTFACLMLNANMPPNWIAKVMLGHKNTKLLFEVYGNYWDKEFRPPDECFDFLNPVYAGIDKDVVSLR